MEKWKSDVRMFGKFFIAVVVMILCATPVKAECHFRSENAIMCEAPANAVMAYKTYEMDFDLTRKDYSLTILHSSGCNGIAMLKDELSKIPVKESGRQRYATTGGWVELAQVYIWTTQQTYYGENGITALHNKTAWYGPFFVVADYLVGTCDKYVVKNEHHVAPLSFAPDAK